MVASHRSFSITQRKKPRADAIRMATSTSRTIAQAAFKESVHLSVDHPELDLERVKALDDDRVLMVSQGRIDARDLPHRPSAFSLIALGRTVVLDHMDEDGDDDHGTQG